MTATISPLTTADREAVTRLLDGVVGAGFWSFAAADEGLSFVARTGAETMGVILACIASEDEAASARADPTGAAPDVPDGVVLHLRKLAVATGHRRAGAATRLLRRVEREGRARGASLALVYAWLPAGRAEPESVPLYRANGYSARRDIPGFYAASSETSGAVCPYCGDPPCRCAARVFIKELQAPA